MEPEREILPKEAAERLGVSLRTVYRLATEGLLPHSWEEMTTVILVIDSKTVEEVRKQLPEGVVKPRQVRKILLERSKK